ncbi:MAG: thioredoxin family protein [Allgaiera sp.]|jgi:thioredoxin-related protein|nr:thioredoxin family protein [Allgaiera sp.]
MRRLTKIFTAAVLAGATLLGSSAAFADAKANLPTLGDDGLYHPSFEMETFKDLRDDLTEANASGKRLLIIVEQRGCIYCKKMETEVFPDPAIHKLLTDKYFVEIFNMWGDTHVTDFDGKVLTEKEAVRRWGVNFTPTMIFLPETVPAGKTAAQAAVLTVPGAFGKITTRGMLLYVLDRAYEKGEGLQQFLKDGKGAEVEN